MRIANMSICKNHTVSSAWINPEGKFIPLKWPETHDSWAEEHGTTNENLLNEGWIRVSNVYDLEIMTGIASVEAMFTMASIVVECMIYNQLSPETELIVGWYQNDIKGCLKYHHRIWLLGEFVHRFGTPRLEEYLYNNLR